MLLKWLFVSCRTPPIPEVPSLDHVDRSTTWRVAASAETTTTIITQSSEWAGSGQSHPRIWPSICKPLFLAKNMTSTVLFGWEWYGVPKITKPSLGLALKLGGKRLSGISLWDESEPISYTKLHLIAPIERTISINYLKYLIAIYSAIPTITMAQI